MSTLSGIDDVVSGVVSNLIVAGMAFAAGGFWASFLEKRRLAHLSLIVPSDGRLRMALPQLKVEEWELSDQRAKATQPPNVPVMPMAEGAAIARLVLAINRYKRNCEIDFFTGHNPTQDHAPIVCIGGPSVNHLSRRIISECFPDFALIYPEHRAKLRSMEFIPARKMDGSIKDDYGFIFVVKRDNGQNLVVLCGVWGTGTEIAARAFIELARYKKAVRLVRSKGRCLLVFHGAVEDFSIPDVVLLHAEQAT